MRGTTMISVQVLLSSFNGQNYIRQQLDSILNQKGVQVYCTVRDDGSTDNTKAILQEYLENYNNIEVVFGKNVGYKASFMQLVEMSSDHDFFAFSDQDDVWKDSKLLEATIQMGKHSEDLVLMYCSNCTVVDEELKYIYTLHSKDNIVPCSKTNALVQGFAHGCTMVFNKNARNLVNKYKPKYEYAHDFWIPLLIIFTGQIIYDKQSHILYRKHTDNVFGSQSTMEKIYKHRIKQFSKGCFYSELINEILSGYGDLLKSEDYQMLKDISDYRSSLRKKLKVLFNDQLKRNTFKGTLFLKISIILSRY